MKIGTTEKLKFKNLQRRLRLPMWQAVGLLECLWKVAYRNAPEGDIGRLSNEDIAAAIEWQGDADELVAALVDSKWLDADETHRLLIHDWATECEAWLRGSFEKNKRNFAKPTQVKPPDVATKLEATTKEDTTKPSLSSLTLSSPTSPSLNVAAEPATWEGVLRALISEGVGIPETAVDECRAKDNLPHEAMLLINRWRELRPAHSVGVLVTKIRNMRSGAKIDWPEPSQEYQREVSRTNGEKKTADLLRERKEAEERRKQNKMRQQQLEADHGDALDAMPKSKIRELTHEKCSALAHLIKRGKPTGLLRKELLLALENGAKP